MITWGFPVSFDLWLAGMAAGAYFVAFLAENFGKHTDHRLLRTALYMGIPAAMAGVIFLLSDLGYPLRFWHLFININFTSPMSIGSWLLSLWIAIGALIVFLWHMRNRLPIKSVTLHRIMSYLRWAGFFASVILMSYTGVLLASSNQPLWASTVLLPPLFVVSSISTGAAILVLISLTTRMLKVNGEIIKRLVRVIGVVIGVELVIIFMYLFLLSQSGIPGANESMKQITTGILAIPFWLVVVLLAILLPFTLNIANLGKKLEGHRVAFIASVASSACVVLGGLALRIVIVIGGQI